MRRAMMFLVWLSLGFYMLVADTVVAQDQENFKPNIPMTDQKRYMLLKRQLPTAVVNGTTITHGMVYDRMIQLRRTDFFAVHQKYEKVAPPQFRLIARDQLIDEVLALQEAAKVGIHLDADSVIQEASQFLGDDEQERSKKLFESGYNDLTTFMNQAKINAVIDKYREYYCRNMPRPTTEEMRAFYEAHKRVFETTPEMILGRKIHLVLSKKGKRGTPEFEETMNRARELIKKLEEGADFAELADRTTEDPKGIGVGGSLGWVNGSRMSKLIWNHLRRLKVGEFSKEPIHIPRAIVILYVEDRKPPQYQPFEEAIPRIIRGMQIEKLKEHLAELRKDADIVYYEDMTQGQVLRGEKPKKTYLKY